MPVGCFGDSIGKVSNHPNVIRTAISAFGPLVKIHEADSRVKLNCR